MASTAPISFTGLSSGLDTASIVTSLMAADQDGLTKLTDKQTSLQQKQSAYSLFRSNLSSLLTTASALTSGSLLSQMATPMDSSLLDASAASGAIVANYNVTILHQATQSKLTGTSDLGLGVDPTAQLSSANGLGATFTAGTISVNGQSITINATDSLNTVLSNIQTATGGAVSASYNAGTDKVTLTSSSGPLLLGSSADTSNLFSMLRVTSDGTATSATSTAAIGGLNIGQPLNLGGANDARLRTAVTAPGNAGSFTVNGVSISYDPTDDTVGSVLNKINNSAANVSATYDKLLDRVVITSKTPGASNIAVQDVSGNFASALGLMGSTVVGSNAQIQIDGVNNDQPITSTDNIFTEAETGIAGLTLTVKADSGSTQVAVTPDQNAVAAKVQSFVDQYNKFVTFVGQATAVSGTGTNKTYAPLYGEEEVRSVSSKLRELVGGMVSGATGGPITLAGLGIGTTGTSATLSFDSSKLATALTNNPNNVLYLIADKTNGAISQVTSFLTTTTDSVAGPLSGINDSLNQELLRQADSIARYQKNMDMKEANLKAQFAAMETAITNMNKGVSSLLSALG